MASLDARGDISAALIAIYTIILSIALGLALRHGFAKKDGWFFIVLFAICKNPLFIINISCNINGLL